jgi:hypothetical protein
MKNRTKNRKTFKIFIAVAIALMFATAAIFHFKHHEYEERESSFIVTNPWRDDLDIKEKYA